MASINSGTGGNAAQVGDLATAIAQWFAAATVVTAAAQYVPPGGAATSTTVVTGFLVVNKRIVIDTVAWEYTGDAANVGGQLLLPTISRRVGGVETVLLTPSAGTPTTAGLQGGSYTATSGIQLARGDLLIARVTPSALLTAVCTTLAIAVG